MSRVAQCLGSMLIAVLLVAALLVAALLVSPLAAIENADETAPAPQVKPAPTTQPAPTAQPARQARPLPRKAANLHFEAPSRIYRVECRITERDDDGQDKVLSQPTVATIPNQPAHVQIGQQTPIVTGAEPVAVGGVKPNIAVLTTGLSIVMTIAPDREGRVTFDVKLEHSDIESVDVTKHDDGSAYQSARVVTQSARVIDSIALDKKFVVGIDHKDPAKSRRRAEFVVAEIEAK